MKFKSILGSSVLIAASFMFISNSPAQAGECSAEDPCQTWAVINESGLVTNIIVCQPSVCGSGEFAGSKVALQVPANPVTHESQGGYWGGPDPQSPQAVHYDSEAKVFTRGSEAFPAPSTRVETFNDGTSITTLQTTVKSKMLTFGPENFVNREMKFTPVIDDQTGAELYVYHYVSEGFGLSDPKVETLTFDSPKTKDEIAEAISDNNLNLLSLWIDELLRMLDQWVKP
jgi:hypothetical protein